MAPSPLAGQYKGQIVGETHVFRLDPDAGPVGRLGVCRALHAFESLTAQRVGQGAGRNKAGRTGIGLDGLIALAESQQRIAAAQHCTGKILADGQRLVEGDQRPVGLALLQGNHALGVQCKGVSRIAPHGFVDGAPGLFGLALGRQGQRQAKVGLGQLRVLLEHFAQLGVTLGSRE